MSEQVARTIQKQINDAVDYLDAVSPSMARAVLNEINLEPLFVIEGQHRILFEALKLALACEPDDWGVWRDQAQAAVDKVVSSMRGEAGAEPSSASLP